MIECKYHKDQGRQVSIQVPLYVHSRVDDIIQKRQVLPDYQGLSFTGWVVTNTRFSEDSIQYAKCSGLNLLGWNYPHGNGLQDIIQQEKIYPITVLTGIPKDAKRYLLEHGIVTCSQLMHKRTILDSFELSQKQHGRLLKELENICG